MDKTGPYSIWYKTFLNQCNKLKKQTKYIATKNNKMHFQNSISNKKPAYTKQLKANA